MDLLNKTHVRNLINEIESSQNKERREKEIKSGEVYSGNLKHHVESRIKQLYPKTYGSFSVADLNLSKKINDKLSKAYKTSPLRELDTEKEDQAYNKLMSDADASHAWQTYDLYYNLHRYACMWFSFVEDSEGEQNIVLRPLSPYQFSRVVNDIGETTEFIVNFPDDQLFSSSDSDGINSMIQDSEKDSSIKRYALWNAEQHVVIKCDPNEENGDIFFEQIVGNELNVNQLGMIPAVFSQQGDNIALPTINPITSQVIEYNQQYSVMLTGSSLQTFGHLVLKHPAEQPMPDEIYNSLFTYSRLPQVEGDIATELDYLNPNPNLTGNLEILSNYGHQIISEHLGDGSQNITGSDNFTSGLDRMIAMSDITNIIESNQQAYAKAEDGLYQIVKAFSNESNRSSFSSEKLIVKYSKSKPIQSEKEMLENIEKKIQLGLIEKHEALMILDPNMTPEKAREKVDKIKLEKDSEVDSFFEENNANKEE